MKSVAFMVNYSESPKEREENHRKRWRIEAFGENGKGRAENMRAKKKNREGGYVL